MKSLENEAGTLESPESDLDAWTLESPEPDSDAWEGHVPNQNVYIIGKPGVGHH